CKHLLAAEGLTLGALALTLLACRWWQPPAAPRDFRRRDCAGHRELHYGHMEGKCADSCPRWRASPRSACWRRAAAAVRPPKAATERSSWDSPRWERRADGAP